MALCSAVGMQLCNACNLASLHLRAGPARWAAQGCGGSQTPGRVGRLPGWPIPAACVYPTHFTPRCPQALSCLSPFTLAVREPHLHLRPPPDHVAAGQVVRFACAAVCTGLAVVPSLPLLLPLLLLLHSPRARTLLLLACHPPADPALDCAGTARCRASQSGLSCLSTARRCAGANCKLCLCPAP